MKRITTRLNVPCNVAVLTVGEVAEALRYTPEHVVSLIEAGQIKAFNFAVKTSGRPSYRIPRSSFERLLRVKSNLYDATTDTELAERPLGQPVAASREFPIGIKALTIAELAARWGCTEQHVSDLIEGGSLAAFDVSGGAARKHWRFPFESVSRFETVNSSLFNPATGRLETEHFFPARKFEQERSLAISTLEIGKKILNRRQCAAAAVPAKGQSGKPAPAGARNRKAIASRKKGGAR